MNEEKDALFLAVWCVLAGIMFVASIGAGVLVVAIYGLVFG